VDEQAEHPSVEQRVGALSPPRKRLLDYLPWLVLGLVALAFLPTLGFGFVNWDDGMHVLGNPAVVGTGALRDRWLTPSLGYPVPVTVLSYRLEYLLAGGSPWLYHATNLLLHLGICGLLYGLGRRLGLGKTGASVAMLFFGLHPVVAEPVSWISGRKELLAALFGLLATYGFLGTRRARAVLLATAFFALAAFSKPSVLALPLAWFFLRAERPRTRVLLVLPALLVAAAAATLTWLGESRVGAVHSFTSPWAWAREIHYALGYHLGLGFLVQHPLAKHIPARMPPWFEPAVDLFPVGIGLLLWLWLRRMAEGQRRVARLGLLFALAAYLPSSGLAQLTRYLADSYVYLPLAGLAWLVGASIESVLPVIRPLWRWLGGLAVAVTLLLAAMATSAVWRDSVTLWQTVLARYPDSPQVCVNLGNGYFEQGKLETALYVYELCHQRFGPGQSTKNRAITLFGLGRYAEAKQLFEQLRVQAPSDPAVRKYLGLLGALP
jgi:protein O-mannosyl-transferase